MNNQFLVTFFSKTSKIFEILNITENKEEILKNLVGSLLMNFGRIIASDDKIAPYLQDYSQANDVDPNKLFDFLDSKGVDYNSAFVQAEKESLDSFVKELVKDLPQDKVEELNKIIPE